MGYKKPERWGPRDWRWACETVELAIKNEWQVTTRCSACQVELRANLWLIAATRGPRWSLWNQSTACTVKACRGRRTFWAHPPEVPNSFEMVAERMPGAPSI